MALRLLLRVRSIRDLWSAGGAQACTVLASLLPVLFGLADQLVFVVQVSAISALMVNFSTLGANILLPREQSEMRAARFRRSALTTLSIASLLTLVIAYTLAFMNLELDRVSAALASAAMLLFCQGVYVVFLADSVRVADSKRVYSTRLTYGTTLLVLTLSCCLFVPNSFLLVVAASVSFLLAGLFSWRRAPKEVAPSIRMIEALRETLNVARESKNVAGAQLLGGFSSQAPGYVVAALGPLAPVWAIVVRIVSGFQSIGVQLIGPKIDIAMVTSIRQQTKVMATRVAKISSIIGIGLGTLALSACLGTLWWAYRSEILEVEAYGLVAICLFAFSAVAIAPIDRLLGMVGDTRSRLCWDIFRFIATAGVVAMLSGNYLGLGLAAVALGSYASYFLLLIRELRDHEPSIE